MIIRKSQAYRVCPNCAILVERVNNRYDCATCGWKAKSYDAGIKEQAQNT